MDVNRREPPREFRVGDGQTVLRHSADVELDPDEQVTFVTPSGTELDLVRKAWGYYATPSMNGRLQSHGLRAALVLGKGGKLYLHLVESGQEDEFESYLRDEGMRVVSWLDSDEAVSDAVRRLDDGDTG